MRALGRTLSRFVAVIWLSGKPPDPVTLRSHQLNPETYP
jgi:hypothetical protein